MAPFDPTFLMTRRAMPPTREPRAGTVTRLCVQAGQPGRTALYIDGRPAVDIATPLVDEAGLHTGDTLTAEDVAGLLEQDELYRARSHALRLLATRDRSTGEVESGLQRAGFTPEIVTATVTWLQERRYVDDERFAQRYIEQKSEAGWGENRVRSELTRRGIDRIVIEASLLAFRSNDDVVSTRDEALLTLLDRRFSRPWAQDPTAARRRLAGFLARRGFDWEAASQIIRLFEMRQEHPDTSVDRPIP